MLVTLEITQLIDWIDFAISAIESTQAEYSCSDSDDEMYERAIQLGKFYKSKFSQGGDFEVI